MTGPVETAREPDGDGLPPARIVGFSPDRTLYRRPGSAWVVKVYEVGGLDRAQAESEAGRRLAGPGIVVYGHAFRDPSTGRPAVRMAAVDGVDLARRVELEGPLPPREVAAVGARVAATLARLAAKGLVHRDVKPANLIVVERGQADDGETPDQGPEVVLVDCEHGIEAGAPVRADAPFTGGTHGYAPPEAYRGASPGAAFDVFGLGATLYFLATGSAPFEDGDAVVRGNVRAHLLAGLPVALRAVILGCMAPEPQDRPGAAAVAARLSGIGFDADAAVLDRVLAHVRAADFARAEEALAAVGTRLGAEAQGDRADDDAEDRATDRRARLRELTARLARDRRLAARLGPLPDLAESPSDLLELAAMVSRHAGRVVAFLRRFPLHPTGRAARSRIRDAGARLLREVAPTSTSLRRAARYADALKLLDDTGRALDEIGRVWALRPPSGTDMVPPPIWRRPHAILAQLEGEVRAEQERHEELLGRLQRAEAELDLERAQRTIEAFAAMHGGASEMVGRLKDRLHSLGFYLARLGSLDVGEAFALLRTFAPSADEAGAEHGERSAIEAWTERCRAAVPDAVVGEVGGQSISPRAARRTANELLETFPWLAPTLGPGADALDRTLGALTREAWRRLGLAEHSVQNPPIPIRTVREQLEVLDELRIGEVLIDLPGRTRAAFIDGVEAVRERLEQARSARNQIARGARDALQKGHITTALFDMSRAVDRFEDASDEGAEHLARQLEETRQRKEEVERRIRTNQALALRYAELVDDATSRFEHRVGVLEERIKTLLFLGDSLGDERGEAFRRDRRDTLTTLLQEHGDQGERELTAVEAGGTAERAAVIGAVLQRLQDLLATWDHGEEVGATGRSQRLLQHWEERRTQVHRDLWRQEQARVARRRRTRLLLAATATAVVLVLAAAAAAWLSWG